MTNAAVNPDSSGSAVAAAMWPATMLAATCPPIDPPIRRMIVLIPVATPVLVWSTASTIRFAIEANENPTPRPSRAVPT
jgi:hypothetical protein